MRPVVAAIILSLLAVVPPPVMAGHGLNIYSATKGPEMSATVADVPERVYVPNAMSNTLDVIDPKTYRMIARIPVGREPQHVTPSWDLSTLYVLNTKSDTMTVVDPRTGTVKGTVAVLDPYNLYFTPDGSTAIVVAERFKRLDFRDPKTWALRGSVPIPYSGVDHMDFSADGTYLLASCEYTGWVVRVDIPKLAVTGAVKVGGLPVDVKTSPDGSVVYVANQRRNGVSVIDPVAMKEIQFIKTGVGTHGLYLSRDTRRLYATNRHGGSISVIDVETRTVVATWKIGGTPDMGGVTPDGKYFWVSGRYDRVVYVVDTSTGQLVRKIRVGKQPHGVAFFPQPGRYSLGHNGVYR